MFMLSSAVYPGTSVLGLQQYTSFTVYCGINIDGYPYVHLLVYNKKY